MPPEDPQRPVASAALGVLRERLRGAVLTPQDGDYPTTRTVWNADRQRKPALIVLAADARDTQHAVRFAREHDLPLAVRSTGFSPAGHSTCEGGVVLDLRNMRRVRVDRARERVLVEAGARWGDVDVAAQRVGQIVPGASLAGLGVAGSTLSGGAGHLRRLYGLACDNLLEATVVGPGAESITTSGDERPELLWGLRGGGGNFGVATSLTFRLRPLPDPVLSGTVFFAASEAERVLTFYREWTGQLRDDVTTTLNFFGPRHSPALVDLLGLEPDAALVGVTLVCAGHPHEAQSLVRPLREAGPVLRDTVSVRPYAVYQAMSDNMHPFGDAAAMDSGYLDDLDDDVVGALAERFAAMPATTCELHVRHMGGAVGRIARMSTAVANRGAPYMYAALARWPQRGAAGPHHDWVSGTVERLRPLQVGGPGVGLHSTAVSSVQAYGAERYLRLAALKRRFDPDNVFSLNQNVTPLT